MGREPRIVIIGAGIVGASIAFHLSLRSRNIVIVEADQPGKAASHASYAWINARPKPPRHYHDLSRRSLDTWSRFERRLGGDVGITWGGELRWTATENGAENLRAEVALMQSWGYPIRLVSADEFRELEPGINADPITAAAYGDHEGHVDTATLIARCLDEAMERGVKLLTGTPVKRLAVEARDGKTRITGVETPDAHLDADVVVLAAGYSIRDLAAEIGFGYPQIESPGATLLTAAMPPILETVACIHTPRDLPDPQMNFRQLPDGRVQVHGGTHLGSIGDNSIEEAEWMLAELARFVPAVRDASVVEWRRAMRPMPHDGFPIIGFPRQAPNLYFACMHSGVTLAALVGELATIEILDRARVDILEEFRYDRFASD